jgi:hypothetical protein
MRSLKKLTKIFSGPAGLKFFPPGGTPWLQAGQRPAATPATRAGVPLILTATFGLKNTYFFRDEGGGELFILSHSDMAPR